MKESLAFYNGFDKKLILDYKNGNIRIKNAIETLSNYIPDFQNSKVLDIGCGLGWSTFEFSRFFPNCAFQGIDLSPVLIQKASQLFQNTNLKYSVFDITKDVPKDVFDAVIMIDVYEHIPVADRENFHISLLKVLKPSGRLILACPTQYHQSYLKAHHPKGLQPIDEDVNQEDMFKLSRDIKGDLIYFEFQTIWRAYDYFYAVIQKEVLYDSDLSIKNNEVFQVECQNKRIERLNKKLGLYFKKGNSLKKILRNVKNLMP